LLLKGYVAKGGHIGSGYNIPYPLFYDAP